MLRRIGNFTLAALTLAAFCVSIPAQSNLTAKVNPVQPVPAPVVEESDRGRDGLVGPVRRVRTEVVKLSSETGKLQEGKHAVLEVASYDIKGNKIENQYFPIAGANVTGKEVYKYDEKGNISEMTLLNADGSLVSKEVYKYEFDFAGNWNKMTTAIAVIEAGKMSFEPTEVTYRSIMYYLDENMMKMAQPATQPTVPPVALESKIKLAAGDSASQKASPSVPDPVLKVDKVNLGSVEAPGVKSNATVRNTLVNIDSEPPPLPKPILKPVSGGVLNGTAIDLPFPIYPETARRLRVAGLVSVDVVVDESGKVISAVATSGPSVLREVAVQAALRARFSPTKLSGQPVKVSGLINYKFALSQ